MAVGASGIAAYRRGRRSRSGFAGKVCLITGGSRGFGLILAREFAQQGAVPAICARSAEELEKARRDFARMGKEIDIFRCDISDRNQVREWVRTVHERLGRIDILVNNAGIMQEGPFEALDESDFRQSMEINFFGMLNTIFESLPYLKEFARGRIINITSIGGQISVPHLLAYTASKFATVGLSLGLRTELQRHGIHVTTVLPGLMRTGSFLKARFKGDRQKEFAWFSLNASLPILSMDAERAARKVIRACRSGRSVITLGIPAKIGRIVYAVFPGTISAVFSGIDRLLPKVGAGKGPEAPPEEGKAYSATLRRSRILNWGTRLGQRAAGKFLEQG